MFDCEHSVYQADSQLWWGQGHLVGINLHDLDKASDFEVRKASVSDRDRPLYMSGTDLILWDRSIIPKHYTRNHEVFDGKLGPFKLHLRARMMAVASVGSMLNFSTVPPLVTASSFETPMISTLPMWPRGMPSTGVTFFQPRQAWTMKTATEKM